MKSENLYHQLITDSQHLFIKSLLILLSLILIFFVLIILVNNNLSLKVVSDINTAIFM